MASATTLGNATLEVIPATQVHADAAQRWRATRGMPPWPADFLHGIGFAVEDQACVWIYPTGGPLVLLEHLVANPSLSAAERDEALDAVVSAALADAAARGGRFVFSVTTIPAVIKRAERLGFVAAEATVLVAKIGVG